jgi:hypothetical protein
VKKSYWYCPHCKEEICPANVTFQELHDTCGHEVKWIENIDFDRLREMCEAEREQRCVVLPVKEGTTVYNTYWWDNVEEKCTDSKGKSFYRTGMKHKVTKSTFSPFHMDYTDWGKRVFLTKAEAEAALKGASND